MQTRIITQPETTNGAVANPNSCSQQRGDDDVAAGLELSVDLEDDTASQPVRRQRLMRLGESEFPRRAGVLQRRERCGAGATVVTRDEDHVRVGLGDARDDRADALLADELHVDARL